jgi:hypothetical protein
VLALLVGGCTSSPPASTNHTVTKQQVIDAFSKLEGRGEAEKAYDKWMAEIRPEYPDDETARRKILQTIEDVDKLVSSMMQYEDETKDRLLHQTDHQAVLAAARHLIQSRRDYPHDPAWHGPEHTEISFVAADDPRLSSTLRDLHAAHLFVTDDRAVFEFGGGFHHFGLLAFRQGVTNEAFADKACKKLIDDLWFYEDTH